MSFLSLLGILVYAAEIVVSPLGSDFDKPIKSFSQIGSAAPVVLGIQFDPVTQTTVVAAPTQTPMPSPTPTPTVLPSPIPSPSPALTARSLRKNSVTIAVLGDSMVDTLGPGVIDLEEALKAQYPGIQAKILNYGVGATNIDYGIERITSNYEYLGTPIPALASQRPDIVIVESFGYNPYSFDIGAIDKHWMALSKAVDTLKTTIPGVKIVIAATIAPNAKVFGDGAANLAFNPEEKWKKVDNIKKYLESTTRFAKGQNLPLADAYHPSLGSDGNGNIAYINAGDHIHTSPEGRKFFAAVLTKTLIDNKLLE